MNNGSIMIVEDERIVAEDMRQVLEYAGYEVCGIAKDSVQALECARKHHPDLVLMDIVIRGEHDGIETAKMLQAEQDMSFIYLTAYSQEGVVERAKETEPLAYIIKPFEEATLLSTIDIGLHKARLDSQMRKSRELFFTTLKSIGDGVISTDVDGAIVFMNDVAEKLTGWLHEEAAGLHLSEVFQIINEESRRCVDIPSLLAIATNKVVPLAGNTLLISKQGKELPIDDAGSPIHDAEGKTIGSVLIFRDVTDKQEKQLEIQSYQNKLEELLGKQTEEARHRLKIEQAITSLSAELIRLDLTKLDQGLSTALDRIEKVLNVPFTAFATLGSDTATCWGGSSSKDIPRETFAAYLHRLPIPADAPNSWTKVEDLRASSIPADLRALLRKKGVTSFSVISIQEANSDDENARGCIVIGAGETALKDEDIRMLRMLLEVMQSVIARQRVEEDRETLRAELLQSQKMEAIGKLSGGIAHDFNNLLLPILGHCELLLENEPDQDSPVHAIQKAAENAAALTRQLLAFSRKQVLRKEPVVLAKVVAEMRGILSRIIGEDVEVRTEIEEGMRPAFADPGQLGQILLNLVVNARDAMKGGGQLTIATRTASDLESPGADSVAIDVIDTGCGIEQSKLGSIFEPFYSSKGADGTGLGLSVVKGIVEQHGGSVRVASTLGEGTTFTIILPASDPIKVKAPAASPRQSLLNQGNRETGRILLIEDEPAVMQFVQTVLTRKGYTVEAASTVADACKLYDSRLPDEWSLVFSDAMLPDGTGLDVINHVATRHRDARILLSSGYSDNRALVQLAEERMLHFLPKPYTVSKLYAAVTEAMKEEATVLSA